MPRATTAACEVMPPRVVRMPSAACMPWMSSGLVSTRTRMTLLARRACSFGLVGREHDLARRRAGRRRQAGRDHVALGLGIDGRMQQLIERGRIDARHRLFLVISSSLASSTAIRTAALRGALAGAGLQHPELALLDRELDVLHVAVVLLELRRRCASTRLKASGIAVSIDGLSEPASLRAASVISCGVRMPATTSSPCALIRNSP